MSAHPEILDRHQSVVLVIDLQDAYRGKLFEEPRTIAACRRIIAAAGILGIPAVLTEQYPKGLGATRDDIESQLLPETRRFEKTSFSVFGAPGLEALLQELARPQVVVIGIETHVCVNQSVHDLLVRDYRPHLVRDAITSRFKTEDRLGWSKMLASGAIPGSTESVLFEWLRDSRSPEFKEVHKLLV